MEHASTELLIQDFMGKKKMKRDERRWLKKAGFGRGLNGLGGLAVALHEAETGCRPAEYALQADTGWGKRTRRRVRRERWNRRARCVRRMGLFVLVYGGSLAAFLLLVGGLWSLAQRLVG